VTFLATQSQDTTSHGALGETLGRDRLAIRTTALSNAGRATAQRATGRQLGAGPKGQSSSSSQERICGVGLIVFAHEPHVPEELFKLENVVLMPHRCSAAIETRHAMGELVLKNVAAYFAGQELLSVVV